MASQKVTITNRVRDLGFGYSTSPVRNGGPYDIELPRSPVHTGTYRQVLQAMQEDRVLKSFYGGGVVFSKSWFVGGRRIVGWPDPFFGPPESLGAGVTVTLAEEVS